MEENYYRMLFERPKNVLLSYKRNMFFDIKRYYQSVAIPTARKIGKRLNSLQGSYSGQRCFIMGNGPSLNRMDLSLFENDLIWGSNKCYLLFDRISWRPSFYVGIDKQVIPDIKVEISELTRNLYDSRFFFPFDFYLSGELLLRTNSKYI